VEISILTQLGAGGHGDVFLGQRRDTGERVVVKFLRESHLADARKRFAREVRILAKKLRGVVPLVAFDLNGSRPYYVMPFLANGAVTKLAGRLTSGQMQTIARETAAALHQLHSSWIAHGDVKPDNLLITGDGHFVLADPLGNGWGCTVIFSEEHGGTPGYWAPEIRNGGKITQAGDIYSFGVTLHHLGTGVLPTDDRRVDLASFPQIPPNIREVISACCVPDPGSRPSALDVLRILDGESWADIQRVRLNWTIGLGIAGVGLLAAVILDDAA
jgi:serine/threonine protein kinase